MEAALPSTASPERSRLAFLDAARGTAMLMMVLGHVNDGLLSPQAKTGSFFEHYWAVRGLTAPLFLFVSGFAFVVASNPRWEEFRRLGPRLNKRLRRIGLLLLLGTFIQMPRWYGTVFIEQIFGIDGIGHWGLQALQTPIDVNVISCTVLVGAVLIVMANLLVDIVYSFLDPRVSVT